MKHVACMICHSGHTRGKGVWLLHNPYISKYSSIVSFALEVIAQTIVGFSSQLPRRVFMNINSELS